MRSGLVVFAIIFLVVGGVLYFYPSQTFSAQTNSASGGTSNVRNSSAVLNIPVLWSYALLIIGALLLILGLAIPSPVRVLPSPVKVVAGPRGPRGLKGKVTRRPAPVRRLRSRPAALPRGTSVTTTTRIRR